jgi:hypothetical protein
VGVVEPLDYNMSQVHDVIPSAIKKNEPKAKVPQDTLLDRLPYIYQHLYKQETN